MWPYESNRFGFAPREHRPRTGPAWQLNTGAETANRAVVTPQKYQFTDFTQALKPRLGGLMKPQFDFSIPGKSMGESTPAGETGAGRFAGIRDTAKSFLTDETPLPEGPIADQPPLDVPTDAVPPQPLFSNVTDDGANPTPAQLSGGYQSSTSQERRTMEQMYPPASPQIAMGGVTYPY